MILFLFQFMQLEFWPRSDSLNYPSYNIFFAFYRWVFGAPSYLTPFPYPRVWGRCFRCFNTHRGHHKLPRIVMPITSNSTFLFICLLLSLISPRAFLLVGREEVISYSSGIPVLIIVSGIQESVNKYLLNDWTNGANASGDTVIF